MPVMCRSWASRAVAKVMRSEAVDVDTAPADVDPTAGSQSAVADSHEDLVPEETAPLSQHSDQAHDPQHDDGASGVAIPVAPKTAAVDALAHLDDSQLDDSLAGLR